MTQKTQENFLIYSVSTGKNNTHLIHELLGFTYTAEWIIQTLGFTITGVAEYSNFSLACCLPSQGHVSVTVTIFSKSCCVMYSKIRGGTYISHWMSCVPL